MERVHTPGPLPSVRRSGLSAASSLKTVGNVRGRPARQEGPRPLDPAVNRKPWSPDHAKRQAHHRGPARLQGGTDAQADVRADPAGDRRRRDPGGRRQHRRHGRRGPRSWASECSATSRTSATARTRRPATARRWSWGATSSSCSTPTTSTTRGWSRAMAAMVASGVYDVVLGIAHPRQTRRCAAACRSTSTSPTAC